MYDKGVEIEIYEIVNKIWSFVYYFIELDVCRLVIDEVLSWFV